MSNGINSTAMGESRAFDQVENSSPNDVRRAGGSDPHRYDSNIAVETKVRCAMDMPGINKSYQHNDPAVAKAEAKAASMGTPHEDGTYSY